MAHITFQNNNIDINSIFYQSHKQLIKNIAIELDITDKDRQNELIKKFLGDPMKIKKQRDPLLPKKPNTSFIYFCGDYRDGIRTKNPDLKIGGVMKELGKMWESYDNKDKYIEMAKNARELYNEEIETYNLTNCYN